MIKLESKRLKGIVKEARLFCGDGRLMPILDNIKVIVLEMRNSLNMYLILMIKLIAL